MAVQTKPERQLEAILLTVPKSNLQGDYWYYEREVLYNTPGSRHRADFRVAYTSHSDAYPPFLIECQGGVWSAKSGHSGGTGITIDCIRGNIAAIRGYRVLRFTSAQIAENFSGKSTYVRDTIMAALGIEEELTEAEKRIREIAAEVAKEKRAQQRRSRDSG